MNRSGVGVLNLALFAGIALVLLIALLLMLSPSRADVIGYVVPVRPPDPTDPFVLAQRNSLVSALLGITGTVSLLALGAFLIRRRRRSAPDWVETLAAEGAWAMPSFEQAEMFDPESRVRRRLGFRGRRRTKRSVIILAGMNVALALAILSAIVFLGPARLDTTTPSGLPLGDLRISPVPLDVYLLTAAAVAVASIVITVGSNALGRRIAAWRRRAQLATPPPMAEPELPPVRTFFGDGEGAAKPAVTPLHIAAVPLTPSERLHSALPRQRVNVLAFSLIALALMGGLTASLYLRITALETGGSPATSPAVIASVTPSRSPGASIASSAVPSTAPSSVPSAVPSTAPSSVPSTVPSTAPSASATALRAALPPCPGRDHCGLYITQSREYLLLIGGRFDVSLRDLIAANPEIRDPSLILTGQPIRIPR